MALRSFRVENKKALRLAECADVPAVMVIAGPNGVGKSTLLHALSLREGAAYDPDTQVIYQPPHRAIRRQQVRRRWLGGQIQRLPDIFSSSLVSGFEGLNIQFPARAPDNVDEAGSTIKYTLGRIENRRQTLLAELVDRHYVSRSPVNTTGLPDVYEPLRRLTERLLPHLAFQRVDFTNEDDIKCVFRRTDVVAVHDLDLDDLSSGEKAILLLFLPMIEDEINQHLESLSESAQATPATLSLPDRVILIDEPEQHLHPDLQARILGYLRDETVRRPIQFIITTHSPTLVDQAFDTELYMLGFPQEPGKNQLRRVATTVERLDALKALAGSTYVVTTGRSIICMEGTRDGARATDVRLLEILHPQATRYTFVPVGGKGSVITAVRGLRESLPAEHFGIRVLGIVDRDRSGPSVDGVVSWPVCTIENLLLLDPGALVRSVQAVVPELTVSAELVRERLQQVAREQREEEIRIRVMEALGPRIIRIKGVSLEEVREALANEIRQLELDDGRVREVVENATREIDQALADGSYVEKFRGKDLLRGLYGRLGLSDRQVSLERFAYAVAKECAQVPLVQDLLRQVFAEIEAEAAT